MTYLVKIDNNAQGIKLVNYLKTLDFVKIIEPENSNNLPEQELIPCDYNGIPISIEEFNQILEKSELTENIPFMTAFESSELWKNQKN